MAAQTIAKAAGAKRVWKQGTDFTEQNQQTQTMIGSREGMRAARDILFKMPLAVFNIKDKYKHT